ncbi:MAG TPA: SPFH domain-containing protein [Alphaproteobacteria bacterium]|nr:SPFH domain-containing protein [Alphaproteobacteria bacterium]
MTVILTILASLGFLIWFRKLQKSDNNQSRMARLSKNPVAAAVIYTIGGLVFLSAVLSTSLFYVDKYETGHVVKKFGGSNLASGKIIATDGENGPQAYIYGPGWHLSWFIRIWGEVSVLPVVEIPPGHFGEVNALDGRSLPEDAVIAPPLPGTSLATGAPKLEIDASVFEAAAFLNKDELKGYKGLQSTVLKPGVHRLNLYLFNVRVTDRNGRTIIYDQYGKRTEAGAYKPTTVTEIPTGHVGVVKSNLDEGWNAHCREGAEEVQQGRLKAVLVPSGCKGVWKTIFEPGAYFFNPEFYEVTMIPTRAQRWSYHGGYEDCRIDLTIGDDGTFDQNRTCVTIPVDTAAADEAIFVRVEGWEIPVELRILVQINPDNAALVVAAVGGMKEVEDRIVTPTIRSIVRNIGGGLLEAPLYDSSGHLRLDENNEPIIGTRPTRALDFQDSRPHLEAAFEKAIKEEGNKAGISILEVKIDDPAIPPELLVSRRREQLAQQLTKAFREEKLAQDERVKSQKSRATADQQKNLVTAEISVQVAEQFKIRRQYEGEAEKTYLTQVAEGQKAQAQVLGEDVVARLRAIELVLEAIKERPQIITDLKLPATFVMGNGSDLSAAAAVFGSTFKAGDKKQ